MPIWLTILLALGGSTLISLIVNALWKHSAAKLARIQELEKNEAERVRREEERSRQEEWEQKVLDLVHPISAKLDEIQEELKQNKAAATTGLRTDLMLLRDRYRDNGYASRNDKAAWNQLYNDYKALGGNHFNEYVNQWRDEVNDLPTVPDVEHGKGRRIDDKKETE